MKKILIITLFMFSLLLTSCFDSMQSVSYQNGQYKVMARITIAKDIISALVALDGSDTNYLDSFGDFGEYDEDENPFENLFGDSFKTNSYKLKETVNDLYQSLKDSSNFPDGGYTKKIDTNADVGIQYNAIVDADWYDKDEFREYIPRKYSDAIRLELSEDYNDSSLEELSTYSFLFSGLKHRIYFDKNILPTLSKARVTDKYYSGKDLTFYDTGKTWCVELPYSFLMGENSSSYKYIVMYY